MFLSSKANSITPYVAGEQPQDKRYVKLNTNENPYAPSQKTQDVLKAFNISDLRLYPDPNATALAEAIAKAEGVNAQNIFIGNGSDEVLALSFRAFFNSFDKPIMFADITYSFYTVYCDLFDIKYLLKPLNKDYEIVCDDYINNDVGGIVIANPNAPTSIAIKVGELEKIIQANSNVPIIIDEAYVDFAYSGTSCAQLTKKYANLLVVKTFSKSYALAGIRCGYAIGNSDLIEGLNRIKNSFNSYPIDVLCQKICAAAIADREYFNNKISEVVKTRDSVIEELRKIGYKCANSQANFLFVTPPDGNGKLVYEKLKNNGILVRFFNKPRLIDKLRISIGDNSQMQELIQALKTI